MKHPSITAGIVGGVVTLGSCELASADQKACFLYSGGAALGLGLVVAAAMWLGTYEDDEAPTPLDDGQKPGPEPEPEPDRDLNPEPGVGSGSGSSQPAPTPPPAPPPPPPTPPANPAP